VALDGLRGALLVVEAAAAVPVWLPGCSLLLPLVVTAHPEPGASLPVSGRRLDPTLVVVRRSSRAAPPGLVRVALDSGGQVLVWHPSVLAGDVSGSASAGERLSACQDS
jgi:hypothetical protein